MKGIMVLDVCLSLNFFYVIVPAQPLNSKPLEIEIHTASYFADAPQTKTREELIKWARDLGGKLKFGIIIAKSDGLWKSRNDIIFSNGAIDAEKVIDEIKLLSWRWGLSRHNIPMCLFYEWCWNPGLCLRR
ncbi:hypothetical protein TSUD_195190 [Trifolium subterraneum]|nr:hypothetical protein TSUD_195190 [Trifolium subterraneum]